MKRKNSSSLFFLVIVIAIIIVLISVFLSSSKQPGEEKPQTVQVLAASENLPSGSIIDVSKMIWLSIEVNSMNDKYIPKSDTNLIQKIDGSVVKKPISKNEIVNTESLIDTHGRSALSAVIQDGMRAVTVPYANLANAPSLIAPGDIIDIILPKRSSGTNNTEYIGETILQNIRVLAVDNSLKKTEGFDTKTYLPKSITLEVSAEQAESLAASIRDGQVVVSMHSVFSKETPIATIKRPKEPEVTEPVVKAPVEKPQEDRTVQVHRGSEKSQQRLDTPNPIISFDAANSLISNIK